MRQSSSPAAPPATAAPYAERLGLPWWAWPLGLAAAALLAVELWMGATGVRAWLPFVLLIPAAVAALWWLGRIRVEVRDGELRVDDAHLPVRYVADVVPLDAAGRREVLGVGSDPLAFVVQRPWIDGAVQVVLDDPEDPTPFWVVSTRHPVQLAAAVLAARDAA
ncbi:MULTISPECIES: DUF3093 domain-containing protein [Micromonospora]|uniref:DUF3093 domain-containing protein n=1 Tax=Micromonospora chalcea TaxID=1874 RepID=A0ABX9YAZ7_MICCH|nr:MULTISPECIES: DUF3093 domain-containing protein [Micromonospora]MBC8992991.1 DUF3093 domain-containing protein [Micromonospora chalcea]MBP1781658.1 hypothetical protein [Micromonospora sp. HB375]MBQ1063245.1 DUF3093 domain-containing protein [Micromonospora sp. C41]MBQ1065479.1 DUF3093 domain-containing protein [Micromonospora sp. D75]MDH6466668.1 hypothetical protein [Micromonospora sp. H404/HB375]